MFGCCKAEIALRSTCGRMAKTTSTDQNGQFLIHGIAPNNYALFAWETLEPAAYEDHPEFLKLYCTRGKSIAIR